MSENLTVTGLHILGSENITLIWELVTFHSLVSNAHCYLGDCEGHSHEILTALSGKFFH